MHRNLGRISALFVASLLATSGLPELQLANAAAALAGPRVSKLEVARLLPGSRIWIDGTSTLHAYASTATRFEVAVLSEHVPPSGGAPGLEEEVRAGGIGTVEVSIPVAEMRSEKAALDKNLRAALKAAQFPRIECRLERYSTTGSTPTGSFTIEAGGTLKIAGVERPVDLKAQAVHEKNGLRISGTKQLLMTDYGIKPPTMMLGALRVSNLVVVHFDLLLGPADPAGAEAATGPDPTGEKGE